MNRAPLRLDNKEVSNPVYVSWKCQEYCLMYITIIIGFGYIETMEHVYLNTIASPPLKHETHLLQILQ